MTWRENEDGGFVLVKRDGTIAARIYPYKAPGWAWRVDDERGGFDVVLERAKKSAKRAARRAEKEKA